MTPKQHIRIIIFLHQDLAGYSKDKIYNDYFSWLKTELEIISGRTIEILLIDAIEAQKLTTFNYKNEDGKASLNAWKSLLYSYVREHQNSYPPGLPHHKYLLLTRDSISRRLDGIAEVTGQVGIASINTYQIPGHEIGHMLGATHKDSEVIYNGWWHETIMSTPVNASEFRGNAYRYSDSNRDNIRNYLNTYA